MIALRVHINGKHIVTGGQDDWSVLTTHVTVTRKENEGADEGRLRYSTGGMSLPNEDRFCQHFRWDDAEIKIGDKVEIEIVSTEDFTPPMKRYRSDREVQESPFTEDEEREMRYENYLELKKEFESGDT